MQLEEEELKTQDPEFWNDPKSAETQLKKIRNIKIWVEGFEKVKQLVDDLNVLYDFYKEGEVSEEEVQEAYNKALKEIEDLEFKNYHF